MKKFKVVLTILACTTSLVMPQTAMASQNNPKINNLKIGTEISDVQLDEQTILEELFQDSELGYSDEQIAHLNTLFDQLESDSIQLTQNADGSIEPIPSPEITETEKSHHSTDVSGLMAAKKKLPADKCVASTEGVWVRKSTGKLGTKPTTACTHTPRRLNFTSQLSSWGIWKATVRYSETSGPITPRENKYKWTGMKGMKCHTKESTRWQAYNTHTIIDYQGCKIVLLSRSGVYTQPCRHS